MEPWQSGLLTIVVSGIVALASGYFTESQKGKNSRDVATIGSQAELQDSLANWAKTATDVTNNMLAPLASQLDAVTKENLTLQKLIAQLRTDNDTLRVEQQRLKQVEANQRQKIDAQAKEIDHLKARLASLEKLDIQRRDELKAIQDENEKLQAKVERITAALDTGKFGKE